MFANVSECCTNTALQYNASVTKLNPWHGKFHANPDMEINSA